MKTVIFVYIGFVSGLLFGIVLQTAAILTGNVIIKMRKLNGKRISTLEN